MEKGKRNWVFCDGDLPAKNDPNLEAHESLMILNISGEDADIDMTLLFSDKEPKKNIKLHVKNDRVLTVRMDRPLGDEGYMVPYGQYAIVFESTAPVFAVFGRLDTTQANMSFYTVQGHNY